jgi:hypothetical protein
MAPKFTQMAMRRRTVVSNGGKTQSFLSRLFLRRLTLRSSPALLYRSVASVSD